MEYLKNIIEIVQPEFVYHSIDNEMIINFGKDTKLINMVDSKNITISATDIISFHILRLLTIKLKLSYDIWIKTTIKIKKEQIFDYINYLKELTNSNFYDLCTICGTKHENLGLNYITSCNNKICDVKKYHYPINNKITEMNKTDNSTMMLLFRSLFSIFIHPKVEKILTNIPKIYSIHSVKELQKIIPKNFLENKFDDIEKIISETFDDFYLWNKLNDNLTYALLINALSDNFYSMYSYRELASNNLMKKNMSTENDIEYFNISYSSEIEEEIKSKLDTKTKYYYLYHGSPFYCWYSIIKTGLKVMSNTEFMTTGAVYGAGIYLSDHLNVSFGYARQCSPFNYSMIGLFQVIENPQTYLKATSFYVVPNEKLLVLRSLIKINKISHSSNNAFSSIDNYFIRERTIDKDTNDKNLISVKNKRLSAELKLIDKFSEKFIISKCFDEEEKPWQADLLVNKEIYNIEIKFYNYPLFPPIFKIINFTKEPKGIINNKFIINLPILEPGTWNITNKIGEVLNTIWIFLNETY